MTYPVRSPSTSPLWRSAAFLGLFVTAFIGCSSSEGSDPADAAPTDGATTSGDSGDAEAAASDAGSGADSAVDAAPVKLDCSTSTLGYPCRAASGGTQCLTGGDCYGVYLNYVCGPTGRECSASAPTCTGAGETCRLPLMTGGEDGICLTDDEATCFCAAVGGLSHPPFCK